MAGGAYERALQEARAEFAAVVPGVAAQAAGVIFTATGSGPDHVGVFAVPYLDTNLQVEYPAGRVLEAGEEVTVAVTIVVLHYLSRSVGATDLTDPVRFQGLPGAGAYTAAFRQHAEAPIIKRFGEDGPAYVRAVGELGGRPAGAGPPAGATAGAAADVGAAGVEATSDASPPEARDAEATWVVPFLPHLPLGLRLGLAEDVMPAECVVLFPKRAGFVYHVEDLAVAGELLSARLLQVAERQVAPAAADGVVVLATVYDPMEAEIIVAKLRSAGIEAVVRHDALSVVYGLTVDGCGRSEVLVREDSLLEAQAALPDETASEAELELDDLAEKPRPDPE